MTTFTPAQRREIARIAADAAKAALAESNTTVLDIFQVSERTRDSPDRIRHIRCSPFPPHPLYHKAFKSDGGKLRWWAKDVDAYMEQLAARTA